MTRERDPDTARTHAIRWVKFNSVGIMGFGVQLVTLVALTEYAALHYLASVGIAVEIAVLHNFLWHERWTWRDRLPSNAVGNWRRLARFNLVNGGVSVAGQIILTGLYTEVIGLHYALANLLAIASCSLINFGVNDRLVFRAIEPPRFPRTLLASSDVTEQE